MANAPGEALAARLLADAPLGLLIGTGLYPSKPTQEPSSDYAVYFKTGGGDGLNAGGRKTLQQYTFRVEATARTDAAAQAILKAVVDSLTTWADRPGGVQGCFAEGDADDATLDDGRQVCGQTFRVFFQG